MKQFRKGMMLTLLAAMPLAAQAPAGTPRSGATPAAPPNPAIERIEAYYRSMFALGNNYQVKVSPAQPSPVQGLMQVTVEAVSSGQTSRETSYVSADGRYLIRGEIRDMTLDPFAESRGAISLSNQPARGPADAPVTIVEYSDFQCPYCRATYETLENKTLKKYPNVRLVYKDFPLTNIHPWAEKAALAGQCAYIQSNQAFWQLYTNFFEFQKDINVKNIDEKLEGFGKAAGLDLPRFKACISGEETRPRLEQTKAEIQHLGLSSTPTLFINGRQLVGNVPEQVIDNIIQYELQQKTAASKPAAGPKS